MSPNVVRRPGARQRKLNEVLADLAPARVQWRIWGKQPDPRVSRRSDSAAASLAAAHARTAQARPQWPWASAPVLIPRGALKRRREAKPRERASPLAGSRRASASAPLLQLVEHEAEDNAAETPEALARLRALGAQRRQHAPPRPEVKQPGQSSLRQQMSQDLEDLVPDQPMAGAGAEQVHALVSAGSARPAHAVKQRRVKCPREVQVFLSCADRDQGFVRSVTALSEINVPELRRNLRALQTMAKNSPLTYAEVQERLNELRARFSSRRGRVRAAPGQGGAVPEDPIAAEDQPSASASSSAEQRGRRKGAGSAASELRGLLRAESPVAGEGQAPSASSCRSRRGAQAAPDQSVAARKLPRTARVQSLSEVFDLDQSDALVAHERGEAEFEDDENPSEAAGSKHKAKARRRAAGSVKALALKKEGKGLFKQKNLSPQLQAVVKQKQACYTDVVKLVWKYIKEQGLQDKADVLPDETLKMVCDQPRFHWSQLGKFLKGHLT